MKGLDELLGRLQSLPALPALQARLIELAADPATTPEDILRVVEVDPGMTATLLRLANTARFGGGRTITSLREAVIRLGINQVLCLALASSDFRLWREDLGGYGLRAAGLWRHSVAAAYAAQALARRAGREDLAPSAFTAGLLSIIGKIVLSPLVQEHREAILEKVEKGNEAFDVAEEAVLGIHHAEAGARLAELWRFPPPLVEAIRHAQRPGASPPPRELAACAHLAEMLTLSLGYGVGDADELHYEMDPAALEALGLQMPDVERAGAEAMAEMKASQVVLEMVPDDRAKEE